MLIALEKEKIVYYYDSESVRKYIFCFLCEYS